MKKLYVYLFLVFFALQTPSSSDDIRDFQIEGMSIGDSALDFFSEEKINDNEWDYYKNKKFTPVQMDKIDFFETYDAVDFDYKTNDENYIIYSISGVISFKSKNISKCFEKMDEIDNEVSASLKNFKRSDKKTWDHPSDLTGESKYTDIYYESNTGIITITCYKYSSTNEGEDHLSVAFSHPEWVKFIRSNPY